MSWNQNSGYGQAMLSAIHSAIGGTFGNVFVVMNSSDSDEGNYQHLQELFPADPDGRVKFYTSLASAYAATESNNNDVIILDGNSTHSLSGMLTVSNNRVHFIGLDYLLGIHRSYGQSSKVSIGVTTDTADIAAVEVTGTRCSFRGIKFSSSNTLSQGKYTFVDAGEYTYIEDCEFYLSSQLTVTSAAEFVANGDSGTYKNCTFGSNVITLVGAIIRPCVILTRELVSGKVARDVTFEKCRFWRKVTNSANAFVWATTATDVERQMEFRDCLFYADVTSTATAAVAVGGASALTVGRIVLTGSTAEVGCTALATQTGIWSALPTLAAAGGSALQAT